jgi:hypothetical protein
MSSLMAGAETSFVLDCVAARQIRNDACGCDALEPLHLRTDDGMVTPHALDA